MTRALAARFGDPIRLRLLRAGPVRATPMELAGLELQRFGERVYGREIELRAGPDALLRARTVTPLHDPSVPLLAGLGRRPLAELLFDSPRFVRDPAIAAIVGRSAGRPSAMLGRCCRWHLLTRRRTGTLLVEEYFQPAFFERLADGL